MSTDKYILTPGGEPMLECDSHKWGNWFETERLKFCIITELTHHTHERAKVSTVFLGIDHSFGEGGDPILWETMVFGGPMDEDQRRCTGNQGDARVMHAEIVHRLCEKGYMPIVEGIEIIINEQKKLT